MTTRPIKQDITETIMAEWRTGAYSQQALADKHRVSKGYVNKLCKGVHQDMTEIVTAGVAFRVGLADHDDRIVTAVTEVVDERTKHIQFFNRASIKNVESAVGKISEKTTIAEHKMLAETILRGKETVLGKSPETAVQVNNMSLADALRAAKREQPLPEHLRVLLERNGKQVPYSSRDQGAE